MSTPPTSHISGYLFRVIRPKTYWLAHLSKGWLSSPLRRVHTAWNPYSGRSLKKGSLSAVQGVYQVNGSPTGLQAWARGQFSPEGSRFDPVQGWTNTHHWHSINRAQLSPGTPRLTFPCLRPCLRFTFVQMQRAFSCLLAPKRLHEGSGPRGSFHPAQYTHSGSPRLGPLVCTRWLSKPQENFC